MRRKKVCNMKHFTIKYAVKVKQLNFKNKCTKIHNGICALIIILNDIYRVLLTKHAAYDIKIDRRKVITQRFIEDARGVIIFLPNSLNV